MMADIPLLASIPMGDGPNRVNKKLRESVARIARRVAAKALITRNEDVMLEVYCAGLAHGLALAAEKEPAQ